MQYIYDFDTDNKWAHLITEGEVTADDLIARTVKIFDDPRWSHASFMIDEFVNANLNKIHRTDMFRMSDELLKQKDKFTGMCVAYVASQDLEFGLLRMWSTLEAEKLFHKVSVFRTVEEAITWIKILSPLP